MYINQIEQNVTQLSNNVSKKTFIYNFLLAYGLPKSTITLLRKGSRNLSKRNDQVILKKKIFFQEVLNKDPHETFETVRAEKNTYNHQPRFVIVTDYKTLLAVDSKTQDQLDIQINEIDKDFVFFLPLAGMEKTEYQNENPADVKAAERMAKIYDEILKGNEFITHNELHGLNVFLSRLLFCFFAEDTGIFEEGIFTNSISSYTQEDGSDLHLFFHSLFEILNRSEKDRSNAPEYLNIFPYVNGGLFKKRYSMPKFSAKCRKMIIESGKLNWSQINPDIFGSMMQAVIHTEQRSSLGMHYTSVPNIMKVISPLFMDNFRAEFQNGFNSVKKLEQLLSRLMNIRIFDPACGSGNFLIIAYKEIRSLEIAVFKRIQEISPQMSLPFSWISLSQFYGIEMDDFACEMASLSLWLAEHQMNVKFKETFGHSNPSLPLKQGGNIICENSVLLDWEDVCPKNNHMEIYILGNPPYLGARVQDKQHKADLKYVFSDTKNYKNLDYITCWVYKGAKYIQNCAAKLAFVSTNSICQGEQVELLWPKIFKLNLEIFFAYTSFKWTNNAKNNAGVTCCIIGLQNKQLKSQKILYKNDHSVIVDNINAYLTNGRNIFVGRLNKPLFSNLPKMCFGNMPNDGGGLILSNTEKEELLLNYPDAKPLVRRLVGSNEFIRGSSRWCLWISDDQKEIALKIPPIKERILIAQKHRESSKDEGTKKLALRSYQFRDTNEALKTQLIIPRVSSENREYLPIGFVGSEIIILDSAQAIYDPEPFIFGLIASKIHFVWVRAVAGYLESRIRYSATICYNNFPIPDLSEKQKEIINIHVYNVLEEREKYPEKTIAELYDPQKMPSGLRMAHVNLDLAVELCYRSKPFNSDEERLEYLFNLYEKRTRQEKEA